MKINEEKITHYYIDDDTGKWYTYDKEKGLIEVPGHGTQAGKNKPLEIGDRGDEEEEKREWEEREKELQKDIEAGDVDAESDENKDSRIKNIADLLNDPDSIADELVKEVSIKKDLVKQKQAIKNAKLHRYASSSGGIDEFKHSLKDFIAKQIGSKRSRVATFSKFNPTYQNTNFVKAGHRRERIKKIPVLNVYFDRSGSWGPDRTEVGEKALAVLHDYEQKGLIQINLRYFNSEVMYEDPGRGHGGTSGLPILRDIQATKPDNVVIMTDDDIPRQDDYGEWSKTFVTVPGGVWFLFNGGESLSFMEHLRGRGMTKKFIIQ